MDSFQLKGDNGYIQIGLEKVLGYPKNTSHWGGYEVKAKIEIKSSNYTANGELWTSTGEIYEFYQALKTCQQNLKGMAHFENYENNLKLQVVYNEQGHTLITGEFREKAWEENELRFEIRGDQSYFNSCLIELQRITTKYGDNKGIQKSNS